MNRLWIYRIAVVVLAVGLAAALLVRKDGNATSETDTAPVVSGWRNIERRKI